MKKKSDHEKAQEITNKILEKSPINRTEKNKDEDMRFEAGEGFDSLDFSPESRKKD